MLYRFIGDVHGKVERLPAVLLSEATNIQLGDLGIGFFPGDLPIGLEFIRGNHDNPKLSRITPGYMGDYGYRASARMLFVGGGESIDALQRLYRNMPWWPDEELSYEELLQVISLHTEIQPNIVISHEGPREIVLERMAISTRSRTSTALQFMLEAHPPDYWICGHYHRTEKFMIGTTHFIFLGELDTFDLEVAESNIA